MTDKNVEKVREQGMLEQLGDGMIYMGVDCYYYFTHAYDRCGRIEEGR